MKNIIMRRLGAPAFFACFVVSAFFTPNTASAKSCIASGFCYFDDYYKTVSCTKDCDGEECNAVNAAGNSVAAEAKLALYNDFDKYIAMNANNSLSQSAYIDGQKTKYDTWKIVAAAREGCSSSKKRSLSDGAASDEKRQWLHDKLREAYVSDGLDPDENPESFNEHLRKLHLDQNPTPEMLANAKKNAASRGRMVFQPDPRDLENGNLPKPQFVPMSYQLASGPNIQESLNTTGLSASGSCSALCYCRYSGDFCSRYCYYNCDSAKCAGVRRSVGSIVDEIYPSYQEDFAEKKIVMKSGSALTKEDFLEIKEGTTCGLGRSAASTQGCGSNIDSQFCPNSGVPTAALGKASIMIAAIAALFVGFM